MVSFPDRGRVRQAGRRQMRAADAPWPPAPACAGRWPATRTDGRRFPAGCLRPARAQSRQSRSRAAARPAASASPAGSPRRRGRPAPGWCRGSAASGRLARMGAQVAVPEFRVGHAVPPIGPAAVCATPGRGRQACAARMLYYNIFPRPEMPMRRRALLLSLSRPCSPPRRAPAPALPVVASFSILADMAREVGGPAVAVRSLVPPDGDPHVYEPRPSDLLAHPGGGAGGDQRAGAGGLARPAAAGLRHAGAGGGRRRRGDAAAAGRRASIRMPGRTRATAFCMRAPSPTGWRGVAPDAGGGDPGAGRRIMCAASPRPMPGSPNRWTRCRRSGGAS